ncbi:CDGSH iron-sulfur domain-containing protein [Naumannella sp. ID2617S]|uniref:Iron-binding protein n=1 Tax=Enemella dayhoffiae TaxID=2016507 RepID=A0A255H4B0_9ACTN|nr:CDGSH iron-sulfur domain-containing protein [Naumannella sp. ID2617S]OYO22196.1 iron-binding protein [Enemella dayhoffiae]
MGDEAAAAQISVCPDGPLLVRGDFEILDGDGMPIPLPRRTVALCRCGRSANKPWCDATHKQAGGPRAAAP